MFKLESYITPIILSYVDKYVKNIKAEQSQLSLWGGDVVFTNLDLRLDVLEQELRLPFSFVSGHIHELQIHVPWTRLNAEPIVITINTIECILKLPGENDADLDTTSSLDSSGLQVGSSAKKMPPERKKQKEEAPPGYVQSLVNKIISNVSIVCNNLILKYVEEDIVLSLNTRNLKLSSANELWEAAFTELSLPDLIMRKLLKVTDMTVCLDRRNASGKIETYQEPLLYRCSLSVHAAWCYDSLHSKTPSVSRYEIRCPKLDFSLTETQIPMFIRILKLVLALYYGEIAQKKRRKVEILGKDADDDTVDDERALAVEGEGNQSWSGWAWNVSSAVGSTLLPIYWEDDLDADQDVPRLDEKRDRVFHMGLYVDSASLVLKLTEHQSDRSMFGNSKQCFSPFARADCNGIYQELVVKGIGVVNVSAGVSELRFTPVGNCLCGISDTKVPAGDDDEDAPFVQCGASGGKQYLRGSLFEKDFGCESGQAPKERRKSYEVEWDNHLETWTEEMMLERSQAFAFDYLYFLDIPGDYTSEQLSELGYDLEYSNMSERALCRFVLGPAKVNICSGFLHRLEILAHFCSLYDYVPYKIEVDSDSQPNVPAASNEEIDSLMQGTPVRVYQFTAINPSVLLYSADHPKFFPGQARMTPMLASKSVPLESLPGLSLRLECLDGQFSLPMYPRRLVRSVSLVVDPPRSLLQNCHSHLTSKVINLSCHMFFAGQSVTILQPSNFQLGLRQLMLPELWKTQGPVMIVKGCSFDLSSICVSVTRPQVMALGHIVSSQFENNPRPNKLTDTTVLEDALTKKMPTLTLTLEGLKAQYDLTAAVQTVQVGVENIGVHLSFQPKECNAVSSIPIVSRTCSGSTTTQLLQKSPMKASPGRAQTSGPAGGSKLDVGQSQELLLSICLQVPVSATNQVCTSLLIGHLAQIQVNMDPKLFEWFLYLPTIKSISVAARIMTRETSVASGDTQQDVGMGSVGGYLKSPSQSDAVFQKAKPVSQSGRGVSKSLRSATTEKALLPSKGRKMTKSSSSTKALVGFITQWHPTFNSMLIQLRVEGPQIFFPKRTIVPQAEKSVAEVVKKAQASPDEYPLLAISMPLVTLENVTHKPMVQQFLNTMPFSIPESVWNMRRDNLPWTLVLADFSIFSFDRKASGGRAFMLDPVSTSCTLGLNVKSSPSVGNVAFCIHTDMSAIKATVNENQLLLSISILEEFFAIAAKLYPQMLLLQQNKAARDQETAVKDQPLPSSEGSSTGASMARPNFDYFGEATSQQLSDVVESGKPLDKPLSLWLQWTVPQISLVAITTECDKKQFQLRLAMEDCQSSFDWTPVYFKMKCRVLAAKVRCLMREESDKWVDAGNRGIVLSCTDDISREFHFVNPESNSIDILPHSRHVDTTDTSVFNFIFTRAECGSVHKKWQKLLRKLPGCSLNIEQQEEDVPERFVSEVDVRLAPFDVILSPEDMIPFVKMASHLLVMKIPRAQHTSKSSKVGSIIGMGLNSSSLPLVYLKAKTVRVFLVSSQSTDCSHAALSPDFFLVQLDSLVISPQVENPLARILVRPDLYNMAAALLSVPGSQIEDRQYQITFAGFGVYTGKWRDVLKKSEKPIKPTLKTMGENPAFEWNTTKEFSDQQLVTEVLLMPCLAKFDLQVILAPAIVFDNIKKGKIVQTLVAGHAIEINATNQISVYLSLNQMTFFSHYVLEIMESLQLINASLKMGSTISTDSGIDCEASNTQSRINADEEGVGDPSGGLAAKFVPLEILVTGRKLVLSVFKLVEGDRAATKKDRNMWRKYRYKHRRMEILEERSRVGTVMTDDSDAEMSRRQQQQQQTNENSLRAPKTESQGSFDIGYDASEEGSVDECHETIKIYPLFHANASQPHMFVTCSAEKQKFDISVYDASLNLSPSDYFITCGGKRLPDALDYPTFWFQTKQGDVDPKSGIPPALFSCTISDFLMKPWNVSVCIERPLKFDLGPDLLNQFQSNLLLIRTASNMDGLTRVLLPDPSGTKAISKVEKKTVIQQLREQLAKISRVSFSSKQILLHYPLSCGSSGRGSQPQMEVVAGVMALGANIQFASRTKRLVDAMDCKLTADKMLFRIAISGFSQNVLGPWSVKVRNRLSWLPYSELPVASVNVDTNLLQVKIGPNTILVFAALKNYLGTTKAGGNTAAALKDQTCEQDTSAAAQVTEQHYMDDLRAGAFQYITDSQSVDPKPYQVVFSDRPSTMTWRYPQPRTLTRVSVFPVPFISSESRVKGGEPESMESGILCALQYWDACLGGFQTYSEFHLSEHQVSHLNLPTVGDIKRCAVSATWRVLLYYSEEEEEEESNSKNRQVIVTPKSLVSVIRVDSFFSSSLVPKLQISLNVPSVSIDFINQFHFYGRRLPKDLGLYSLNQSFPADQPVGALKLDSLSVGIDSWLTESNNDIRCHLRLKTQIRLDLVDYAFLATHSLVYPFKVQNQLTYRRKNNEQTLDLVVHTKPAIIRAGHFANHTLSVSHKLWQSVLAASSADLDPLTSCDRLMEPFTHFVICNDTPEPIRFGQADTEENQLLRPRECFMYGWRSQKARLLLRVCVEGGYWKWCDPFPLSLSHGGRIIRTIDHGTHKSVLLITCEQASSSTQKYVKISGLLAAANLLKDNLEMRVILRPSQDPTNKESLQEQRTVLASFSTTPSFIVDTERVQGVKIRLLGIGTPWSGEIPLKIDKGRRNSVLVRIPTKDKGQCLTIWCRLCEEKYDGVQRALLLFSPMYMARSLLPNPMKILLSSQTIKKEIELPGRDVPVQLETSGPSDQKYSLAFKVVDQLPPSEPVSMSWGIVEQVRQSVDESKLNIDEIMKQIPSFGDPESLQTAWPFVEDEPTLAAMNAWELNVQPNTDVQVTFTQFHPLCNTLCVDVNPWCLIVNQLGMPLVLKETRSGGGTFCIANNSVLVPPQLQSTFCLGIQEGENDYFSPPLQLSDQEWHFRQLMPAVQGIIPMEGMAQTKIILDHQICFLTIRSRSEHGMRVIQIRPTFLLTNRTGRPLLCSPLSVMKTKKSKFDLRKIDLVSMEVRDKEEDTVTPLQLWQIVGECSKDQLFDGFQHLALSFPDTEWSIPLNLEDCRSISEDRKRKVFLERQSAAAGGFSNDAVLLTIHPRDGQVHIVVNREETPAVVIANNLDIALRYGQYLKREGITVGEGMFLSRKLQLVAPGRKCLYAFPWLTSNFPFREGLQEQPSLVLASIVQHQQGCDTDWEVVEGGYAWSNPVNTSIQHDEFLSLPTFGDIKVTVERAGHTTFVFIDPVSKIEISAKDIRSRIPSGDRVTPPPVAANAYAAVSTDESETIEASFVTVNNTTDLGNDDDGDPSFFSVVSPETRASSAATKMSHYHSFADETAVRPDVLDMFASLYFEEVSFVLSDDCFESEKERDEYVKLTMDSVVFTYRPRVMYTKPLRSCGNQLPRFLELKVCVNNVQLDNQMYNRQPHEFPVILIGQNPTQSRLKVWTSCQTEEQLEEFKRSSLVCTELLFDCSAPQSASVALKSVRIKVSPLNVNVEDQFAYKILQVLSTFSLPHSANISGEERVFQQQQQRLLPVTVDVASRSLASQLYLDEIHVDAFDVALSVHASIKMYIGLDQSPLNFAPFHRAALLTNTYCLGQMLARHYISGALFRAGWVVGSLDLIGSPAGFTRTVGDGLKDFVALPYRGILHGPWAFIGGLTSGSTSLLKHVSAGTLTSMTNFASSVSRNLDRLSLDTEHCQRNEVFRREKPQGLGQGLVNGLSGVGLSLLGAVGGIAHHPISAVMEQGMSPSGLVSGLTRGLIGAVTKPLGGAAEFVAQTGQGLLHGTGWSKHYRQRHSAIPEMTCDFTSSQLKFAWKLASCLSQQHRDDADVLFMAEVYRYGASAEGASAYTLLLTTSALVVVATEEDAQEAIYSLLEVDCTASEDDPTKFTLLLSNEPIGLEQNSLKDRVAQFVLETGLHCNVSDLESDREPEEHNKGVLEVVEASKEFAFCASPVCRDAFLGLFHIARRQARHKGFDML